MIQQLHSHLYHPKLSAYQLASNIYADENNNSLIWIDISHLHMINRDYCMKKNDYNHDFMSDVTIHPNFNGGLTAHLALMNHCTPSKA